MGVHKIKRPVMTPYVVTAPASTAKSPLQPRTKTAVTITSTATIAPLYGSVILNFATDKTARLPVPAAGGHVTVTRVKSTAINAITTKTTAATFFGSTFQTLTFTTALTFASATFEVVGSSTSYKWNLVAKSTGATVA